MEGCKSGSFETPFKGKEKLDNIHAYIACVYQDPCSLKRYLWMHIGDCLRNQIYCCNGWMDIPGVALQRAALAQSSSVFELNIRKHSADGWSKNNSSNQWSISLHPDITYVKSSNDHESELWGADPHSAICTGIAQMKRAAWQRFRSAWW